MGRLLEWTNAFFRERKLDSPRLDAEVMLAHVLSCQRIDLYAMYDAEVISADRTRFRDLVKERTKGKPVAYLVGTREFYSLDFEVNPSVLIPRPETEVLVSEAIHRLAADTPSRFLDIGTGSGAIAISLAVHRPLATGIAVDISRDALDVARRNGTKHKTDERLTFAESDLFSSLAKEERFDVIVSNPPYVRDHEWTALDPEVRNFEPRTALHAGEDGLDIFRRLIAEAPTWLNPGGWLLAEFGIDQVAALRDLIDQSSAYDKPIFIDDHARKPRVYCVRLKSTADVIDKLS